MIGSLKFLIGDELTWACAIVILVKDRYNGTCGFTGLHCSFLFCYVVVFMVLIKILKKDVVLEGLIFQKIDFFRQS